jgi:NADPH-dependent 2,4-dienoyl-CoA reductase/sulfur reductase-like enzyme
MSGNRLLVIGGVAAGMSAASQARRRKPDLEVVVLEKGRWVSYGACGMPYNIQDPKRMIEDLVVITPERFRDERGIDLRLNTEALQIDLAGGRCRLRGPQGEGWLDFDSLVLATGCRPKTMDWPGLDLAGVFALHTLDQAGQIKDHLNRPDLRRAVVIGGGHIGLEMADVLTARGLAVTLVKPGTGLPSGYPDEISGVVRSELERYGVEVRTGVRIAGLEGDDRVRRVVTDGGALDADVVLVAVGVQPAVELARTAGVALGESGAIAVDAFMQTSADHVYAAGDCAEAHHLLLERGVFMPRGTTANKQGRIAGANAAGDRERFRGVLGTSVTKVFSLAVGHTGLMEAEAARAGFEPLVASIRAKTRAHSYPGARDILVRLVFNRPDGRLLGGQLVGGEGVAKRIDVLVAALAANWTVADLAALDLSYAPPFAPVWDPLLVAANQARKKVGR